MTHEIPKHILGNPKLLIYKALMNELKKYLGKSLGCFVNQAQGFQWLSHNCPPMV